MSVRGYCPQCGEYVTDDDYSCACGSPRDYLDEARQIAKGESRLLPQKEHLAVLVEQVDLLRADNRDLMQRLALRVNGVDA